MGKRRSVERERYWRGVVGRQRTSGQSVARYCRDNEIPEASFYYWRRRLTEPARSPRHASATIESSRRASVATPFIPLSIPALIGPSNLIELVHPRGHVLRLGGAFEGEALRRILEVLDQGRA